MAISRYHQKLLLMNFESSKINISTGFFYPKVSRIWYGSCMPLQWYGVIINRGDCWRQGLTASSPNKPQLMSTYHGASTSHNKTWFLGFLILENRGNVNFLVFQNFSKLKLSLKCHNSAIFNSKKTRSFSRWFNSQYWHIALSIIRNLA